jgi:hypothetical protein
MRQILILIDNTFVHLSMKQGSLFCFVKLTSPQPQGCMSHSWYLQNALMSTGALTWFETYWSYGVKAIAY